MVSLGLVTHDHLEGKKQRLITYAHINVYVHYMCNNCYTFFFFTEIQSKRQERKRRTTANPVYSGAVFEPEVHLPLLTEDNIKSDACLLHFLIHIFHSGTILYLQKKNKKTVYTIT